MSHTISRELTISCTVLADLLDCADWLERHGWGEDGIGDMRVDEDGLRIVLEVPAEVGWHIIDDKWVQS